MPSKDRRVEAEEERDRAARQERRQIWGKEGDWRQKRAVATKSRVSTPAKAVAPVAANAGAAAAPDGDGEVEVVRAEAKNASPQRLLRFLISILILGGACYVCKMDKELQRPRMLSPLDVAVLR